ncbi:hypothetical protein [Erythrobacter sp. HKB08]|uniref:hypothetical protein n=1 Tax=Erythrobacter sp. HKB08 TaxID=2502843 RepID=UPI0013E8BB74|nr:hypothetical protein [Erythrobacter sp. HKB08]
MKLVYLISTVIMIAACTVDSRPALTEAQFAELAENCALPSTVRLETEGRDHPMIVLSGSNLSNGQIECIRSGQDRIGATADMAN